MNPRLKAAVEMLRAERLAPVPRASKAVAVDRDDVQVVLRYVRLHAPRDGLPDQIAGAWTRLDLASRRQRWEGGGRDGG